MWTALGFVVLLVAGAFIAQPGFRTVFAGDPSGWILVGAAVLVALPALWLMGTKGVDRTGRSD
ncbi:hypothetical protein QL996_13375 [Planococcus sp. APC 4015]|nr:hypothetical protein [Planococcus sp. APC 4015]